PLFFGLLLIAVRGIVGTSNGDVASPKESDRSRIIVIASKEIGVREATGNNDGKRVEGYLAYTHLGKGYSWCAAFVCWCYGQAGLSQPRNPWSPALFPKTRVYWREGGTTTQSVLLDRKESNILIS